VFTSSGAGKSAVYEAAAGGEVIRWKRYVATNGYSQGTNTNWTGFDNYTTISATSSSTIFWCVANWGNVVGCQSLEPMFAHGITNALDGTSGSSWSGTNGDAGGNGNQLARCKAQVTGPYLDSTTCANDRYGMSCFIDGRWTTGQTSSQSIGRSAFCAGKWTAYNQWTASTPQNNSSIQIFEIGTES
jgi:hypothetical protein